MKSKNKNLIKIIETLKQEWIKVKKLNVKIICLICCRGGSKGIPNKNIKEFCETFIRMDN